MPKIKQKYYRSAKHNADVSIAIANCSEHDVDNIDCSLISHNYNKILNNSGTFSIGEIVSEPENLNTELSNNFVNIVDDEQYSYSEDNYITTYLKDKDECVSNENEYVIGETGKNIVENNDFRGDLSKWAISHNIKHTALSDLLKLLKQHSHFNLPSNARTLLCTPRQIVLKNVQPGHYYHFGLKNCIEKLAMRCNLKSDVKTIEVLINIDGVPLSKSSGSQLYPILCRLWKNQKLVDVVGVYHGNEKPFSANDLLQDFVDEASMLTSVKLNIGDNEYDFRIKGFACDAVAKSYICYVKSHTGFSSCTKCYIKGEYTQNRVCFPQTKNLKKRTDSDFALKKDEDYHKNEQTSLIEKIPNFGMVTGFPIDYMHLVCLGVVRKLIYLWCFGKPATKISFTQVSTISELLTQQINYLPSEFARKPRSLVEAKKWKATELRQFLLYTGPVVLKSVLSKERFLNFLALHVAITILINKNLLHLIDYAEKLLIYFVDTFIVLYGKEQASHNIHNLLHICDDVRMYGALDNYSAFPFENYMQTLKKYIRKTDKPLSQIIARKFEENKLDIGSSSNKNNISADSISFSVYKEHNNEPFLSETVPPYYEQIIFSDFKLTFKNRDNCCGLKNGNVILIQNIGTSSKGLVAIGRKFITLKKLYCDPINSTELKIYLVNSSIQNLSPLETFSLKEIAFKYVKLKLSDVNYALFPLSHSM